MFGYPRILTWRRTREISKQEVEDPHRDNSKVERRKEVKEKEQPPTLDQIDVKLKN
jgi:hypothetical protein